MCIQTQTCTYYLYLQGNTINGVLLYFALPWIVFYNVVQVLRSVFSA